MEGANRNAQYASPQVKNKLIGIVEEVLRDSIVVSENNSNGFSVTADETTDISGTDQLSIGARFVEDIEGKAQIREEFLGFIPLEDMDTATISDSIINQVLKFGLDFDKMHGQGYDRCKTMTRKDNSVQARIRRKHPKETFVHCASHRLNLVVNDLNSVVNLRNTYGTIKAILNTSMTAKTQQVNSYCSTIK